MHFGILIRMIFWLKMKLLDWKICFKDLKNYEIRRRNSGRKQSIMMKLSKKVLQNSIRRRHSKRKRSKWFNKRWFGKKKICLRGQHEFDAVGGKPWFKLKMHLPLSNPMTRIRRLHNDCAA